MLLKRPHLTNSLQLKFLEFLICQTEVAYQYSAEAEEVIAPGCCLWKETLTTQNDERNVKSERTNRFQQMVFNSYPADTLLLLLLMPLPLLLL